MVDYFLWTWLTGLIHFALLSVVITEYNIGIVPAVRSVRYHKFQSSALSKLKTLHVCVYVIFIFFFSSIFRPLDFYFHCVVCIITC